jgi:peptidoglycan/xylan/chitin deacetylase (PgdA/CDA1 family)
LPLDELLSDGFSRGNLNCASIVFNDGFMSTLEFAYPYLSREGVPFAVFLNKKAVVDNQGWITNMVLNRGEKSYLERVWKHVIANPVEFDTFQKEPITTLLQRGMRMENSELLYDPRFGERKLYADRDDVLFLHRNGVLIGSHAVGHFVLSQCTPEQLRGMVRDNRLFLEELLNARIEHFSIPFGKKEHYNEQVLDLIQEEHKYIYNTNPAAVPPPRSFNPRCISQISFENAELSDVIFYLNRTFIRHIDI